MGVGGVGKHREWEALNMKSRKEDSKTRRQVERATGIGEVYSSRTPCRDAEESLSRSQPKACDTSVRWALGAGPSQHAKRGPLLAVVGVHVRIMTLRAFYLLPCVSAAAAAINLPYWFGE